MPALLKSEFTEKRHLIIFNAIIKDLVFKCKRKLKYNNARDPKMHTRRIQYGKIDFTP